MRVLVVRVVPWVPRASPVALENVEMPVSKASAENREKSVSLVTQVPRECAVIPDLRVKLVPLATWVLWDLLEKWVPWGRLAERVLSVSKDPRYV